MKKLCCILVLITGIAKAQVNIPDANFKAKLIALGVDSNADGTIQQSEALALTSLDVSSSNIADMTGIGSFTNLTFLKCSSNPITTLDTAGLTNLTSLTCGSSYIASLSLTDAVNLTVLSCQFGELASLDLSHQSSLTEFYCNGNHLTALDVSVLVNLQRINISNNPITHLDVSALVNLLEFDAQSSPLASLDISASVNLQRLEVRSCALTSLNVNGLASLNFLDCYNNPLPALDLSTLSSLQTLDAQTCHLTTVDLSSSTQLQLLLLSENQLTELDLSHNFSLVNVGVRGNHDLVSVNLKNGGNGTGFDFTDCPNLRFICADDGEITAINSANSTAGVTGIVVNSYCTFVPGGNYNTITGTVTFDANNNGCDANDIFQPNIRINIDDSGASGASFTNVSGNYAFYTQDGNFTLTPSIENPTWYNFSPETAEITFTDSNNNMVTQHFCLSANGIHPDVEVVIAPIGMAVPGLNAEYKVVYKNKGNQTLSGNVVFTYDDSILDFVSSDVAPTSQSAGILNYDYTNLLPFESRSFYITLHINPPTHPTNPVNLGDLLTFTAEVNPIDSDEIPSDNEFEYHQTVMGSFDPNEIVCIEGTSVAPAEIGNYLHYIINFENTGTADAQNVVVRDVIDTAQFDVNSLQLLNSSGPVTARLTGNVAEFIFQNVNLHSGGHGNILLKIKSNANLHEGDTVSKKANIYFDYNLPVETSPENTTFQTLSNPDVPVDASIIIYPNPTKGNIDIRCNNTIKSIQLFDLQGRLLETDLINENQAHMNVSDKSSGVYFVKIISDKGMSVQKIAKE